jgi:hypothetical protein
MPIVNFEETNPSLSLMLLRILFLVLVLIIPGFLPKHCLIVLLLFYLGFLLGQCNDQGILVVSRQT